MLHLDKENHIYTYEDECEIIKIPSVSKVLETVFPLSPYINPIILERNGELGSHFHKMITLYFQDNLDEESLDEVLKKYLNNFKLFEKEVNLKKEYCKTEQSYQYKKKVAGTIDCYDFNSRILYEWKTGRRYKKKQELQMAFYTILLNESNIFPREAALVYFTEDAFKIMPVKLEGVFRVAEAVLNNFYDKKIIEDYIKGGNSNE